MSSKVLLTGGKGFTGYYLHQLLQDDGYNVHHLQADITDKPSLKEEINKLEPEYVIHLAAISFPAEKNIDSIYKVNALGAINLLEVLSDLAKTPKKIILASSATIYGNSTKEVLDETTIPDPRSHYGCSKLIMEFMSKNFLNKLPIIITRPFNYTGIGHDGNTLIPKIVSTFRSKKDYINLGNTNISREFNDVRDVSLIYAKLLSSPSKSGTFNICSGNSVSLLKIINIMESISNHKLEIKIDNDLIRPNEVESLSGCTKKLSSELDLSFKYGIEDTLSWIYENEILDFSKWIKEDHLNFSVTFMDNILEQFWSSKKEDIESWSNLLITLTINHSRS